MAGQIQPRVALPAELEQLGELFHNMPRECVTFFHVLLTVGTVTSIGVLIYTLPTIWSFPSFTSSSSNISPNYIDIIMYCFLFAVVVIQAAQLPLRFLIHRRLQRHNLHLLPRDNIIGELFDLVSSVEWRINKQIGNVGYGLFVAGSFLTSFAHQLTLHHPDSQLIFTCFITLLALSARLLFSFCWFFFSFLYQNDIPILGIKNPRAASDTLINKTIKFYTYTNTNTTTSSGKNSSSSQSTTAAVEEETKNSPNVTGKGIPTVTEEDTDSEHDDTKDEEEEEDSEFYDTSDNDEVYDDLWETLSRSSTGSNGGKNSTTKTMKDSNTNGTSNDTTSVVPEEETEEEPSFISVRSSASAASSSSTEVTSSPVFTVLNRTLKKARTNLKARIRGVTTNIKESTILKEMKHSLQEVQQNIKLATNETEVMVQAVAAEAMAKADAKLEMLAPLVSRFTANMDHHHHPHHHTHRRHHHPTSGGGKNDKSFFASPAPSFSSSSSSSLSPTSHESSSKIDTVETLSVDDSDSNNDAVSCAICLGNLTNGDPVAELPCNTKHIFHQPCIIPWLKMNKRCPLCQTDIDEPQQIPPTATAATVQG